jgi:hypothetical protein
MTIFNFQRGETFSLALDAVQGDVATVSAITARIRRLDMNRTGFRAGSVAVAMTVAARAAAGDIPAGWNMTLAAAASADLELGYHGAEAQLTVGGGVIVTDFVTIKILEPA